MQGALFSAVSGLSANSNAMSVIGNNIANSNTTGFKSNRVLFSDVLAQEVSAAGGQAQIGRGVNTAKVSTDFSPGDFRETGSSTDLAIDGSGFFIMGNPESKVIQYTRDGSFDFNNQGYLVNNSGHRVQGYRLDASGSSVGALTDVRVDMADSIAARQTKNVDLSTNLNANAKEINTDVDFDVDDSDTFNFTSSVNIYDSLGQEHGLTTYFTNRGINETTGYKEWEFNTVASAAELEDADSNPVMKGFIEFDENGEVVDIHDNTTKDIKWNNGTADQKIKFNFNLTQYAGQSEVVRQEQDGYASGSLTGVSFDQDGKLIAKYSNGMNQTEYQLALAQFANADGLRKVGNNLFSATAESGQPGIALAGAAAGSIRSNSLEGSNVDIAKQFTDMIVTQRSYQANARIIDTTSDMMQEVINLAR